jgi:uncharacterized protein (DUF433 family)
MRVTVEAITGLIASGHSLQLILDAYPYLEEDDIREALTYAALHSGGSPPDSAA